MYRYKDIYGVIYKITNIVNKKVYIGQTTYKFNRRYCAKGVDIERVYNYHARRKRQGRAYNVHLLNSIEKYGFDKFIVNKKLDIAYNAEELGEKEEYYIKLFNSINPKYGYNSKYGGIHGTWSDDAKNRVVKRKIPIEQNPNCKKIVCLNTKEIFNSLKEAKAFCNVKIKLSNKSSGKLEDGTRLAWMLYDDYILASEEEINKKILIAKEAGKGDNNYFSNNSFSGLLNKRSRPVICITTKRIFINMTEGAKYYNIKNPSKITCCISNKYPQKSCGVFNNKKLVWKYLVYKHNKSYRKVVNK